MIIFLDENALVNAMPIFVAADPDGIPSPKLTEGDLQCMLGKMKDISESLSQVHYSLKKTTDTVYYKIDHFLDVSSKVAAPVSDGRVRT